MGFTTLLTGSQICYKSVSALKTLHLKLASLSVLQNSMKQDAETHRYDSYQLQQTLRTLRLTLFFTATSLLLNPCWEYLASMKETNLSDKTSIFKYLYNLIHGNVAVQCLCFNFK